MNASEGNGSVLPDLESELRQSLTYLGMLYVLSMLYLSPLVLSVLRSSISPGCLSRNPVVLMLLSPCFSISLKLAKGVKDRVNNGRHFVPCFI